MTNRGRILAFVLGAFAGVSTASPTLLAAQGAATGAIEGRVIETENSRPVAGAQIIVSGTPFERRRMTRATSASPAFRRVRSSSAFARLASRPWRKRWSSPPRKQFEPTSKSRSRRFSSTRSWSQAAANRSR